MKKVLNRGQLKKYTVFITGASRGIGLAIAKKVAADGANVVIAAKTAKSDLVLPGTICSAAEEVVKAGGKALPLVVYVRNEGQVASAVQAAVNEFGGSNLQLGSCCDI